MAKLYFRHGPVNSAKTLQLLTVAHNYRAQGKQILLLKPRLDTRYGIETIASKAGLSATADILVDDVTVLPRQVTVSCVLIDEAHFLSTSIIDQLRDVATVDNVPVICYGLRTDFRKNLFEGSKRLFEVADSIEEIKTVCYYCHKKAIFNLRLSGQDGPSVQLGGTESYSPACAKCFWERTHNGDINA